MSTIHIPPGTHIDPYLKAHRYNTRFLLAAGEYTTGTGWAFDRDFDHCSLGPGCELIGAGSRETMLIASFEEPIPEEAKQIEFLTAGSRSRNCRSVVIRGLAISAYGMTESLGIVGLHVWSDRAEIDDVVVWGIRGSRPDREGFGVLVNQASGLVDVGGSRIEDVEVVCDNIAGGENYVCGVYVGYRTPSKMSVARNIRVHCPGNGFAHAAFGTNGGVFWSNLSNTGRWNRALFCDTGGGDSTIVSASRLRAERVLVEFRGGAGVRWKDILVTDSMLDTSGVPAVAREYAAALVLARDGEGDPPEFDGVVIQNCTIRAGSGDHYVGSIDSPGSKSNGVSHCRLVGAWKAPVLAAGATGMREFGNIRA